MKIIRILIKKGGGTNFLEKKLTTVLDVRHFGVRLTEAERTEFTHRKM